LHARLELRERWRGGRLVGLQVRVADSQTVVLACSPRPWRSWLPGRKHDRVRVLRWVEDS
jgi:hypothetical protein